LRRTRVSVGGGEVDEDAVELFAIARFCSSRLSSEFCSSAMPNVMLRTNELRSIRLSSDPPAPATPSVTVIHEVPLSDAELRQTRLSSESRLSTIPSPACPPRRPGRSGIHRDPQPREAILVRVLEPDAVHELVDPPVLHGHAVVPPLLLTPIPAPTPSIVWPSRSSVTRDAPKMTPPAGQLLRSRVSLVSVVITSPHFT
jgi:hypothetical protein